jgi:hypothetical protein
MSAHDADRFFHETWLGLVQPIEGLVFSVPVLADAQIAPAARAEITALIRAHTAPIAPKKFGLQSVRRFFESFLGYDVPGMLIERGSLPTFYAPESGQEIHASFGIARTPASSADDPFAEFATSNPEPVAAATHQNPILALVWDLADDVADAHAIDLDKPEELTGTWHYPPTIKFERLLRHAGIAVGFIANRCELRLVYAPSGEITSHLTFRIDDLVDPAGRPIALALELLFHARRTYGADSRFTFEGLLAESRRRQADVTEKLADQVFDAVETLLAGFESAAARDCTGDHADWMQAALEAGDAHEGVLNVVLRLVFLLYAEDRSLLPVDKTLYAEHYSVVALYERLVDDAGAHPESMGHRFGAYGSLTALFRVIYSGVRHGDLQVPHHYGKLFDPSAYPFLEGELPGSTAAVKQAQDRSQVQLPTIDDKTVFDVLHGLIVLDGQRLSYRDLSVEQIGAVYESLIGYRVQKAKSAAVRFRTGATWLEIAELRAASKSDQKKMIEAAISKSSAAAKNALVALGEHADNNAVADAIVGASGRGDKSSNRARRGQLLLQPTQTRRSTGSHYTPRWLSERVVRHTLEPIIACLGDAPTAEHILQLKVCDPAMGSGAFLVAACRYLSDHVVDAWKRSGELAAKIEHYGDPLIHAKRLVAERCLYGVDKNAAAVELAKLSLWLETMSADKPFTFLDPVLRHGDSLVGLNEEQVRGFHWAPERQLSTISLFVDEALKDVRLNREAIQELAEEQDDSIVPEKRRLLDRADLGLTDLKLIADACIGAFFAADKPRAREQERLRRLAVVEAWLGGDVSQRDKVQRWSQEIRNKHAPFHWHLELPEVFFKGRPDPLDSQKTSSNTLADAVIGNPPFAGKNGVVALGEYYLDWLQAIHQRAHGNSDLSAHFFRRAAELLGDHGTLGLISTNTIAQGDTRNTGLQYLVTQQKYQIYHALPSLTWPGDAAVSVSVVVLAKGTPLARVKECSIGEMPIRVSAISSQLKPARERADPVPLTSNAGSAYVGSYLLGMGFTLTSDERRDLVAKNKKNAERISPYLGGQEVNTSPTQDPDRYVINFGQMSLEEAQRWPDLLSIVREKVKPERDLNKREVRREYWWRFGETAPALYESIVRLERCLVTSRVTKHLCFSFQPTDRVLSERVYVFPLSAYTPFAILQSRVHEPWTRLLSSTLEDRLNYSASDCFETFPFPKPDPHTVIRPIETIGERLYTARAKYMVDTNQGLTQTYNQLKDPTCDEPPIVKLRALHEDMDRAVLEAYGWSDLMVPPFCPKTPEDQRALELFQDAVIDRLFLLNGERSAEERLLGAQRLMTGPRKAPKKIEKPKERAKRRAS